MRGVADHPHITQRTPGGGVDGFVETAIGTRQHTGVYPRAQLTEVLGRAIKQDGAR